MPEPSVTLIVEVSVSCLSLDVGVTTNWPGVDGDAATVANAVLLDTAVNDEMALSEVVKV